MRGNLILPWALIVNSRRLFCARMIPSENKQSASGCGDTRKCPSLERRAVAWSAGGDESWKAEAAA
jgi:hypothetical protein